LIQGGFCAWCRAGSIFALDIDQSYNVKTVTKVNSPCDMLISSTRHRCPYQRRAPDRTISVCPDLAATLTSASCCRFSPAGVQTQGGLDSKNGHFS
jgi:hypothetical protein